MVSGGPDKKLNFNLMRSRLFSVWLMVEISSDLFATESWNCRVGQKLTVFYFDI
jgi:hypothetical protein